jgi:hypothetical protein
MARTKLFYPSVLLMISALSFAVAPSSVASVKSAAIANAAKKAVIKKPVVKKPALKKPAVTNPVSASQVKLEPTTTIKRKSVLLGTVAPPAVTPAAVAPPATPAPAAALIPAATTASTTTIASTTTTTAPATTVASTTSTSVAGSVAFDFDLQIPSPRVSVNMGSSAAMLVLVLPRGVPRPVDLFFVDLPNGVTATGTPNPTTGGAEVRLNAASLMLPGEYQLRVMAVAGTITKFVGYTLTVLPPGATAPAGSSASGNSVTSTSTTTTTIPSGSGGFTFVVTSDGKKLKTGGAVTLTAVITPSTNFAGSATLRVLDPPDGVWVGYSQNPSAGTSSIWLSSTVALKPGSYQLLVEAKTSTQTTQTPVLLIIE